MCPPTHTLTRFFSNMRSCSFVRNSAFFSSVAIYCDLRSYTSHVNIWRGYQHIALHISCMHWHHIASYPIASHPHSPPVSSSVVVVDRVVPRRMMVVQHHSRIRWGRQRVLRFGDVRAVKKMEHSRHGMHKQQITTQHIADSIRHMTSQ